MLHNVSARTAGQRWLLQGLGNEIALDGYLTVDPSHYPLATVGQLCPLRTARVVEVRAGRAHLFPDGYDAYLERTGLGKRPKGQARPESAASSLTICASPHSNIPTALYRIFPFCPSRKLVGSTRTCQALAAPVCLLARVP